jgi:hypothetical protein
MERAPEVAPGGPRAEIRRMTEGIGRAVSPDVVKALSGVAGQIVPPDALKRSLGVGIGSDVLERIGALTRPQADEWASITKGIQLDEGLAERFNALTATPASVALGQDLADKLNKASLQLAKIDERAVVGPPIRPRIEDYAPLEFEPAIERETRDAVVATSEMLESMVELQREQLGVLRTLAEQAAESDRVNSWRFRWVTVPLLVLAIVVPLMVAIAFELLR